MKIKICGMKYPDNIREIAALGPDYLGFIFHPGSKRYVLDGPEASFSIPEIPSHIKKVGVFVNAPIRDVIRLSTQYEMDLVQLHGDEAPEYCEDLKMLDIPVIKAFGIDESFEFWKLEEYRDLCDHFLFDTRSKEYGGTGRKFDWNILQNYRLSKPFFLSGGIGIEDIPTIYDLIKDLHIHALDLNSKLELEPGLKDIEKCRELIELIRSGER